MLHKWLISPTKDGWVAELVQGSLMVKPNQPHFAMSRIKTGWRRVKGDHKRIVAGFERFFTRLKKTVHDNKDQIYRVEKYDSRYFR
jgi:hypothetical protein